MTKAYATFHAIPTGVAWELWEGLPDAGERLVASGVAFTWQAACHQAGRALAHEHR